MCNVRGGPAVTIPDHMWYNLGSCATVRTELKLFSVCFCRPAHFLQINSCIVALWEIAFSRRQTPHPLPAPTWYLRRSQGLFLSASQSNRFIYFFKLFIFLPKAFREWSISTMKTAASRLPAPITKYTRDFLCPRKSHSSVRVWDAHRCATYLVQ